MDGFSQGYGNSSKNTYRYSIVSHSDTKDCFCQVGTDFTFIIIVTNSLVINLIIWVNGSGTLSININVVLPSKQITKESRSHLI